MCFIILNDLYTAHHNSFGICHQLKIRHLYGTFNFSTQCICMGTGSLFVYGFSSFRGRKTVLAVASIAPFYEVWPWSSLYGTGQPYFPLGNLLTDLLWVMQQMCYPFRWFWTSPMVSFVLEWQKGRFTQSVSLAVFSHQRC